jgi:uncharacterized protein YgiM (DUF1202 family)
MKIYVWLTFGLMGWLYYEMSGGADFAPIGRNVAVVQSQTPEIVARADTSTLLSVSPSNTGAQSDVSNAEVLRALAQAAALDAVEPEVPAIAPPVVVAIIEPELDIREVVGSRVNMRMGPGTGFDVIITLDGGTKLEVLDVDADGWANVNTVDRGIEGWVAERLLTDTNT